MKILIDNGYEAYLVGGAVRDHILNRPNYDYDITTNCSPNQMIEIFSDFKLNLNGLKHGTVGVIYKGKMYEVTTYRMESDYKDHRHPNTIEFSSNLVDDLNRRDFTINAICMDYNDNIIDLVGGIEDIKNKIIRTVLSSRDRFEEDALRILRALRFASTLGFSISNETKDAIFEKYHLLSYISKERIHDEFVKMIVGKDFTKIFKEYFEVFCFIFEDFKKLVCPQNNPYHIYDVLDHTLKAVESIENDYVLKIAMLFHDIGKLDCLTTVNNIDHFYNHPKYSCIICERFLLNYKFSKKDINDILRLIKYHDYTFSNSIVKFKRFLAKLSKNDFIRLISVKISDDSGKNPDMLYNNIENHKKILDKAIYIYDNEPLLKKDLNITGYDLINIGIKPHDIEDVYSKLLDAVYLDITKNNKEELLNIAKRSIK